MIIGILRINFPYFVWGVTMIRVLSDPSHIILITTQLAMCSHDLKVVLLFNFSIKKIIMEIGSCGWLHLFDWFV
jgi:hypothetical protein